MLFASLVAWAVSLSALGPAIAEERPQVLRLRLADGPSGPSVALLEESESLSLLQNFPLLLPAASREKEGVIFRFILPAGATAGQLQLQGLSRSGAALAPLYEVELHEVKCTAGETRSVDGSSSVDARLKCFQSAVFYLVPSSFYAQHPLLRNSALRVELGGTLSLALGDRPPINLPIEAPRYLTDAQYLSGAAHYSSRLNVTVVEVDGELAAGENADAAAELVAQQLRSAEEIWGRCGFELRDEATFRAKSLAGNSMLVLGCNSPGRAAGGEIKLRIDGRPFVFSTQKGEGVRSLALRLDEALQKKGYRIVRHTNPISGDSDHEELDLTIRRMRPNSESEEREVTLEDGALVEALDGPISTDPFMGVCLGELQLLGGLDHFNDATSGRGTLSERALLRQLMDSDPTTIDLVIVPFFSGQGRIGESFIDSSHSSVENVILLDRAGLRASARSQTLAHELGHILLDMPGHPDDYALDSPSRLMDADASDATIFGPRQLTRAECTRALHQSGEGSLLELLAKEPREQPSASESERDQ